MDIVTVATGPISMTASDLGPVAEVVFVPERYNPCIRATTMPRYDAFDDAGNLLASGRTADEARANAVYR